MESAQVDVAKEAKFAEQPRLATELSANVNHEAATQADHTWIEMQKRGTLHHHVCVGIELTDAAEATAEPARDLSKVNSKLALCMPCSIM